MCFLVPVRARSRSSLLYELDTHLQPRKLRQCASRASAKLTPGEAAFSLREEQTGERGSLSLERRPHLALIGVLFVRNARFSRALLLS